MMGEPQPLCAAYFTRTVRAVHAHSAPGAPTSGAVQVLDVWKVVCKTWPAAYGAVLNTYCWDVAGAASHSRLEGVKLG